MIPLPYTDHMVNLYGLAVLVVLAVPWVWPAWREWRADVRQKRETRRRGFEVLPKDEIR